MASSSTLDSCPPLQRLAMMVIIKSVKSNSRNDSRAAIFGCTCKWKSFNTEKEKLCRLTRYLPNKIVQELVKLRWAESDQLLNEDWNAWIQPLSAFYLKEPSPITFAVFENSPNYNIAAWAASVFGSKTKMILAHLPKRANWTNVRGQYKRIQQLASSSEKPVDLFGHFLWSLRSCR